MGNIDLFHSRRANYRKCEYWIRDERDSSGTPQEWVTYNQPSGRFYAKPASPKTNRMDALQGVWAFDSNGITIETDDYAEGIARGCLVRMDGELWLVESVQKAIHVKESEFSKRLRYRYTISMARG